MQPDDAKLFGAQNPYTARQAFETYGWWGDLGYSFGMQLAHTANGLARLTNPALPAVDLPSPFVIPGSGYDPQVQNWRQDVGREGMVPVYGSGKQAYYDFGYAWSDFGRGDYAGAALEGVTGLANLVNVVGDVLMLKSAGSAVLKGGSKVLGRSAAQTAARDARVLEGLAQQEGRLVGLTRGTEQLTLDTQRVCFVAGTRVVVGLNDDGSYRTANIEDLRAGDVVLARDQSDESDGLDFRPVARVFRRTSDHLRVVRIRDKGGNVETIRTTDEHPFWVEGRGWVAAKDLRPGARLAEADGSDDAVVLSTVREEHPEGVAVYNFEVDGDHTYFVEDGRGEQTAVWVHNTCSIAARQRMVAARTVKHVTARADAAAILREIRSGGTTLVEEVGRLRRLGEKLGWAEEELMVRLTKRGTRSWAANELDELLTTGKVKGYTPHHINSVNASPEMAWRANNIQIVQSYPEHGIIHAGNTQKPVFSDPINRSQLINDILRD